MENKDILKNLQKKKNEEYKKMSELDEKWFDENISFDVSMEIRKKYEKTKNKYRFYQKLIENINKGEKNDK